MLKNWLAVVRWLECVAVQITERSFDISMPSPMTSPPFATIIVPTYNQEQYLRAAIDSLLSQTDPDWEAIVVNDGSTDRTAEIADEYARTDRRIRCIHKPNGGVASALNAGLESARGHWIHWLSSDDMFEPRKLEINRRWIERYPEGKFFFSYFTLLTEATQKSEKRELWGPLPNPEYQLLTLFYRNYVSGISISVNRREWQRVGFFDESLHYAQDYDQWLRLLSGSQGIFIPEWTVISRNHAAQGSETFPDACYFDTAKAAIKFINQHSFAELLPHTDLGDAASALAAVTQALDVACERSSFLYCLGPHPALVLRILEWGFSKDNPHQDIKKFVCSRVAEMALREGDDDWSWMWRQLALSLANGGGEFPYSPVEPSALALQLFRSRLLRNGLSHQTIREYLKRFEGIEAMSEPTSDAGYSRIVFFVDKEQTEISKFEEAAGRLENLGYRPVIVISGCKENAPSFKWTATTPTIFVSSLDHNTVPWLGDFELGITSQNNSITVWAGARQQRKWDEAISVDANIDNILVSLGVRTPKVSRPIIFLERILWGGGAERVVFDIVSNLDRTRFRPVVLTMFDEHCEGPGFPADVELIKLGSPLMGRADGQALPKEHNNTETAVSATTGNEVKTVAVVRRIVRRARHFYHHICSPELRMRIGVGQRLVALRHSLSIRKRLGRAFHAKAGASCDKTDSRPSVRQPTLDVDFINAMAQHNPKADLLSKVMQRFGNNSVLIAIMEEASVTAWLAQAAGLFPYVLSLHIYESLYLPRIYLQENRCAAEKWLLSASCKEAVGVVFPSAGCTNDLSENFDVRFAKLQTIWNPVDCAKIRRKSWCKIEAVTAWLEYATPFRMVHVGRLDEQKNHALLLAACSVLKERGRDFSLAIIGEGHDRHWIEREIREFGLQSHVFLTGEQQNPFPWMAAADSLLLTSRFEAFALVLVEAMVCGTAVISVDCPAGPAEVLKNGQYGLLLPNNDAEAIASAVERIMDDASLRENLVQSGYFRAEVFDVKNIVPQWEALLDTVPFK